MSDAATLRTLRGTGALEGLDAGQFSGAELILGHASRRSFYRLRRPDGTTAVLVVYPEAGVELERYRRTRDWLEAAGLPVPVIEARGRRSLLVEDGGDRLLSDYPRDPGQRRRCYRQAIDQLVRLQRAARRTPPPNPGWALDRERLRRELAFTEEHALEGWLGVSRGAGARARGFDRVASHAAAVPTVLCHRDYHARNLLVRNGRLMVLDFQDLMTGPWPYDLASLLWDNYCDLGHGEISELAGRYRSAMPAAGPTDGSGTEGEVPGIPPGLPPAARRQFCIVGLQRSLKALGTFGYQVHVVGNAGYAAYVPRTWHHARRAMQALGWDDLEASLAPLAAASEQLDAGT